jgi:hypothetical protein
LEAASAAALLGGLLSVSGGAAGAAGCNAVSGISDPVVTEGNAGFLGLGAT